MLVETALLLDLVGLIEVSEDFADFANIEGDHELRLIDKFEAVRGI